MKKIIYSMFIFAMVSMSTICTATTLTCSARDTTLIHQKIKLYVLASSAISPQDIVIDSEKCLPDYASAKIKSKNNATDPATIYLNKKRNQWNVLSMGTSFDKAFLAKIPKDIQQ